MWFPDLSFYGFGLCICVSRVLSLFLFVFSFLFVVLCYFYLPVFLRESKKESMELGGQGSGKKGEETEDILFKNNFILNKKRNKKV